MPNQVWTSEVTGVHAAPASHAIGLLQGFGDLFFITTPLIYKFLQSFKGSINAMNYFPVF